MSSFKINGLNITGNNVTVKNGNIIIDGKDVTPDAKLINIEVSGDVGELIVDTCEKINITGNAQKIKTASGDVEIGGDVNGDVESMSGDINCENVEGDVHTSSGDIDCGDISGSVSSMSGDIKHRK